MTVIQGLPPPDGEKEGSDVEIGSPKEILPSS